ncbi:hypothetical protein ACLD32_01670, partial [Salmonella sp. 741265056_HSA]
DAPPPRKIKRQEIVLRRCVSLASSVPRDKNSVTFLSIPGLKARLSHFSRANFSYPYQTN